jgi:hypothetical protein
MTLNVKKTVQFLTHRPLQIVSTPYRYWSDQRLRTREIQQAQRKIAEVTDDDLVHFHDVLWSLWPDAVNHIRKPAQREEISNE